MKFALAIIALWLGACTPAYHAHVTIVGEPDEQPKPTRESRVVEPDDAPPKVVISRAVYLLDPRAEEGVLEGWTVIFRDGDTYLFCREQTIYIDSKTPRWRDHLAHEISEAVICEKGHDPHWILDITGTCYGGC